MRILVRAVVLAVAASLVLAAAAVAANTPVITDPFTSSNGPNSQHATAVEPDTFAFGTTLVVASQVGRFFDGGASSTAFATSTDGGATFTSGVLPGLAPSSSDAFDRTTDPVVAYDRRHDVWMTSSLGLINEGPLGTAVVVNRSEDGGLTWSGPVRVADAGPGQDFDKNWVACDNTPSSPHYGNCYHTWDDFGDGDRILMSVSTDGGENWSDEPMMTAKRIYGIGGQPVVQPDGEVIVPAANAFSKAVIAFRSTDGGEHWGDEVIVSHWRDHSVPGDLRSGELPSSEIGADGRVYTIWSDCRFSKGCKTNSLVMSTSDDGINWSEVRRVPINDGSEQFIPGVGVTAGATNKSDTDQLGLTYYFYADPSCGGKKTDPCELSVGYVQSNNGGVDWSNPQTLAGPFPVTWAADTTQGRMVGDYVSTSWIGTKAFGAYSVASEPDGTVFDQKIFVPTGGVSATTFPNRTVEEKAFSDNGARNANLRSVVHRARKAD